MQYKAPISQEGEKSDSMSSQDKIVGPVEGIKGTILPFPDRIARPVAGVR